MSGRMKIRMTNHDDHNTAFRYVRKRVKKMSHYDEFAVFEQEKIECFLLHLSRKPNLNNYLNKTAVKNTLI